MSNPTKRRVLQDIKKFNVESALLGNQFNIYKG